MRRMDHTTMSEENDREEVKENARKSIKRYKAVFDALD